jgi:hypothetical protein
MSLKNLRILFKEVSNDLFEEGETKITFTDLQDRWIRAYKNYSPKVDEFHKMYSERSAYRIYDYDDRFEGWVKSAGMLLKEDRLNSTYKRRYAVKNV